MFTLNVIKSLKRIGNRLQEFSKLFVCSALKPKCEETAVFTVSTDLIVPLQQRFTILFLRVIQKRYFIFNRLFMMFAACKKAKVYK